MQSRSTLWRELAAGGAFRLESVADIGGVEYASISAPVINRALLSDALSVGNCVSATLQFSLLTSHSIPKSARIVIRQRLTDDVQYSEWLPAGTFFVSKRTADPVSGLLTFQCYDSMLKANAPYSVTVAGESGFPKPMSDCITEIAARMGVEVDARTWDHIKTEPGYVVPLPIGLSMLKVLGYIAGVNGGNFIITPNNKLRFVPLLSSVNAAGAPDSERVNVAGIIGKLNLGDSLTVSRVSISNGKETFTAGNDTGFAVNFPTNPYATQPICDVLYEMLAGLVYSPYTIEKGVYDPAAELGDYVISKDDVRSVLYSETVSLNMAFRGDISAPSKAEMEDEYPYTGIAGQIEGVEDELRELITVVADKASIADLSAVYAAIQNLSVEDIKTGIIHSNDYTVKTVPFLYPTLNHLPPYPADIIYPSRFTNPFSVESIAILEPYFGDYDGKTFPGGLTYPSNGETVIKGFAIDFSTGVIYGAFYSDQIAALQAEVDEINSWKDGVAGEFREELDKQAQDLSDLYSTVDVQTRAVNTLQQTTQAQANTLLQIGTEISDIKQNIQLIQNSIQGLQNALTYPKSPK